jgi:DNA-binding transcriptional ArsR family regulator
MSDVFTAIGDETRRGILECLRTQGPRSLSELSDPLPMTRQAVTKHLDILEGAGLIRRHVRGRERMHTLRAAPLKELDDWLAPYEAEWDARLARLQNHLKGGGDE